MSNTIMRIALFQYLTLKQALLKAATASDEVKDNDIKSLENDLKSLVEGLDIPALKKLLNAAHCLKNTDFLCDILAEKIRDMTEEEEIREVLGIVNDFTPEEAVVRKENA